MYQRPGRSTGHGGQAPPPGPNQVVGTEATQNVDLSLVLINAGVNFAKKNKKITGTYILGLLILMFGTGFAVTATQEDKYAEIMSTVDSKRYMAAEQRAYNAEQNYYRSKGFFSCNAQCMENYNIMQEAQAHLNTVKSHNDVKVSNAKAQVGVFSEYGVQEARDMFWDIFAKGRGFAQRSSWYDMLFMGLQTMGRDESLASVFIRWVIQLVMNFTLGMIGTFIGFIYSLWGMISAYQPTMFEGLIFFALAAIAASSLIISFLLTLYFSAAGTVFVAVQAAGPNLRIGGQQRGRPRYIRQQRYGYGNRRF